MHSAIKTQRQKITRICILCSCSFYGWELTFLFHSCLDAQEISLVDPTFNIW